MEKILLAYALLKETATVMMMLYKNAKTTVCTLDDTEIFDFVAGVGQGDIFALYGGARGVMVIVEGNEHGDTSSKPGLT